MSIKDKAQHGGLSPKPKLCHHSKWITFLSIAFCILVTSFFWLFIFYLVLRPSFYSYIGFADNFVLKKPDIISDPKTLQNIGKMVTDGTLLSLDDFWSFQSNLYQTIITVLIALNGIVAAFSFLIIKNSSTAKAKEEARDIAVVEVNQYVESSKFEKEIKKILYEKIEPVQFDLLSQISSIDEIKLSQQEHNQSFEKLEQELDGLKRNLKLIAESISLKDTSDEDGGNFILGRRT
ncbi:TPA: hypothetical protein ACTXAA_002799 [Raoultella planticola]